jgi:hypothetical protein
MRSEDKDSPRVMQREKFVTYRTRRSPFAKTSHERYRFCESSATRAAPQLKQHRVVDFIRIISYLSTKTFVDKGTNPPSLITQVFLNDRQDQRGFFFAESVFISSRLSIRQIRQWAFQAVRKKKEKSCSWIKQGDETNSLSVSSDLAQHFIEPLSLKRRVSVS